jgi:uncharacterized protein YndB with AHSA1/START domain
MEPLTVSHSFEAPAEVVFDAWVDPTRVKRFLFATPDGEIVRCHIDARVGGRFVITDRRSGEDVDHVGEYLTVSRPHQLAFTFAVPKYSELYTTVTIDLTPRPSGCDLSLRHQGVLPEWREQTIKGWTDILATLEGVLATS